MSMRQRPLSIALRSLLFGGSALLLSSPLLAQTATTQDESAPGSSTSAATPAAATMLANVTVTAQNRSQEMQEVPIALQIVSAKQIDTLAVTDLSKMSVFVPGLEVGGDSPTQPSYKMRGISTSDFGIGTESAVGVYIDGVYSARSGGALLAFNDIKRIEVLKGPQGTLFGRNAAAGAISIVTNEPSDKLEGRARVRIGNYGERYGDALLNLPVNEDMALRFSMVDNQSDGWVKDAGTGRHYGKNDDWGTRASFRWNLTPDTRVLVSWDHEKLKQPPQPAFGLIPYEAYSPRDGSNVMVPPFPADPNTYVNPLHSPLYNDTVGGIEARTFDGVTLTLDHNFGWGSLTSTTAWRGFDTENGGDYDGTNNINTYLSTVNLEHNNSWYQEFKLSGNTDLIDWVGGVSWYSEQARQTSETNIFTDSIDTLLTNVQGAGYTDTFAFYNATLQTLGTPWNQYPLLGLPWGEQMDNVGHFKAYAAYGDVIWHLTDRLNLTTGARFTRDEKTFSWFNPPRSAPELDASLAGLAPLLTAFGIDTSMFEQNIIFNDGSAAPVGVLVENKNTWNNFSPRVVLDYKLTPDMMLYGSVTKGYKAGGYNSVQIGSTFEPEDVTNYEGGIKMMFPEQNLLANITTYYYRYNNRQSLSLDPNSAGSGVPRYLVSSTDQQANGTEFELQWQPFEAFQLGFNAAYIDATYRNATTASGAVVSGQPTGQPKWSMAGSLGYTWSNVFGGAVQANLSQGYRGESRCNNDSKLQGTCQISPNFDTGEAQTRTDARLGWTSQGDRWGVAAYVNNLFDHRYVNGINNISTSVYGTPFASITPPRMWGLEFTAKF